MGFLRLFFPVMTFIVIDTETKSINNLICLISLHFFSFLRTTNNISKQFCPNCGNKTLKRVAVSCNENGSKNIHINFRKPINIRGTRVSSTFCYKIV